MRIVSGTDVTLRRTAVRFFCAAAVFWCTHSRAENLSNGFDLDLSINPGDAAKVRIYGGIPKKHTPATPLIEAFEQCHFEAVLGLAKEVTDGARAYTRTVRGSSRPLMLSGNLAGGMHNGRWVEVARLFDYQNTELAVHQLKESLGGFLEINTLSEAVGSTLFVMPSALSNAAWMKREDPLAYARGTGMAYAYGAHMHVPWCLYDGSQSMRFYGSLTGHQPIFKMIHDNRDFFDGYVLPLWHLALIPYEEHGVSHQAVLTRMVTDFSARGIPLVVRLRDEARLRPGVSEQDEERLAEKDRQRFGEERLAGKERSRHVLGADYSKYLENGPVHMERGFSENFYAPIARVFAGSSRFPMVLHLIRSDSKTNSAAGGVFRVAKEWLPAAGVKSVTIASVRWPDKPEAAVSWRATPEGDLEIGISNVAAWAVVRVETAAPVELQHVERTVLRATLAESEIPLMRMVRIGGAWQRPAWVDKALASDADPLEGYHITRISWSYETEPWELDYARKHGLAFHGSCALLHMNMSDSNVPQAKDGIFTAGPDWSGYARYPNGLPMLIRADFNPPRYGATFASKDYRKEMLTVLRQWIDKGADGVQLDDVFGMLNRVWRYGGDFSPDMLTAVRSYLAQRHYSGINPSTPLDELRDRIIAEMQRVEPVRMTDSGWIEVPVTSDKYPGQVWLGSPELARIKGRLTAELEFFFEGKRPSGVEFSLMNGSRSSYLARLNLRAGRLCAETADGLRDAGLPAVTSGTWILLRLEFDLAANTFRCAVGPDGSWSDWLPFAISLPAKQSRLALNIMVDPRDGSFRLRKWSAHFQPDANSSPVQPARRGDSGKPSGLVEPPKAQSQMGD